MKESNGWTLEAIREHFEQRIHELRHDLEGFPEHYAMRGEVDSLRVRMEKITEDHVSRREYDELRDEQQKSAGRRTAFVGMLGVMLTVITLLWASVVNSALTHADVSAQIQAEAPWVSDRPSVERELRELRALATAQQTKIAQMENTIRFFCRTRTAANLPGC